MFPMPLLWHSSFFFQAHNLRVRSLHGVPELSIHVFSKFVAAPFWVVHFCHLVSESRFCFLSTQSSLLARLSTETSVWLGEIFLPSISRFHFSSALLSLLNSILGSRIDLLFHSVLCFHSFGVHSWSHLSTVMTILLNSLSGSPSKPFILTGDHYYGVRHFWRRHVILVFCVVFISMLWPVHLKLVESFSFFSYFFLLSMEAFTMLRRLYPWRD